MELVDDGDFAAIGRLLADEIFGRGGVGRLRGAAQRLIIGGGEPDQLPLAGRRRATGHRRVEVGDTMISSKVGESTAMEAFADERPSPSLLVRGRRVVAADARRVVFSTGLAD